MLSVCPWGSRIPWHLTYHPSVTSPYSAQQQHGAFLPRAMALCCQQLAGALQTQPAPPRGRKSEGSDTSLRLPPPPKGSLPAGCNVLGQLPNTSQPFRAYSHCTSLQQRTPTLFCSQIGNKTRFRKPEVSSLQPKQDVFETEN